MNNTLRFYTYSDLASIAKLEKQCFSEPWSFKALEDFISYPTNNILVCEGENGIVLGYITFSLILDELQIANVAVDTSQRRQGIGQALVSELIKYGDKKDCLIITLEVRKSNIPAIMLYEKCGFSKVGLRKNYYKSPVEDGILMNYTFNRKENIL